MKAIREEKRKNELSKLDKGLFIHNAASLEGGIFYFVTTVHKRGDRCQFFKQLQLFYRRHNLFEAIVVISFYEINRKLSFYFNYRKQSDP